MKVFKFGGASVRDAAGIRNLSEIVLQEKENLVIVVSAFGKTTNALEGVLKAWLKGDEKYIALLDEVYKAHLLVVSELFNKDSEIKSRIEISFSNLKDYLFTGLKKNPDFEYDQIVSYGELWSTMIVNEYLNLSGIFSKWLDIRELLITDDRFRDANVLWGESTERIKKIIDFNIIKIYVTQGFIGGTIDGHSTTLGREGSDYTAAILANILDAESVVVWKDVPGILNADPTWLTDVQKLDEISYKEAVEMAFSGAKVIHPKTIKPLENKNIQLFVKSFLLPMEEGTIIKSDPILNKVIPVYVRKEEQILISILPKDFSFAMGDNLSRVFHSFTLHGIKVNIVEASAVSIDVCVDDERSKVDSLLSDLRPEFVIAYNENMEMLSIRHYTTDSIERITRRREILLEQRTRSTVRFVVRTI